jgi:hypothetical protein
MWDGLFEALGDPFCCTYGVLATLRRAQRVWENLLRKKLKE